MSGRGTYNFYTEGKPKERKPEVFWWMLKQEFQDLLSLAP
jgi:hypothetical protein